MEGNKEDHRKLFLSLDGVVEALDRRHFPYFNEEAGAALDAADTVLFAQDLR